jgi:hypothetical protein
MIGIPPRSLRQISHTARNRGFDPAVSLIIKDAYVEDAKRSGCPVTATMPEISEKVIALIRQTRATREYSSEYAAWKFGISASSVQRMKSVCLLSNLLHLNLPSILFARLGDLTEVVGLRLFLLMSAAAHVQPRELNIRRIQ